MQNMRFKYCWFFIKQSLYQHLLSNATKHKQTTVIQLTAKTLVKAFKATVKQQTACGFPQVIRKPNGQWGYISSQIPNYNCVSALAVQFKSTLTGFSFFPN